MSVAQRERFDAQLIMCSEYEGLTPQDEREIFQARLYLFLQVAVSFLTKSDSESKWVSLCLQLVSLEK